jgi:hypothetical protein
VTPTCATRPISKVEPAEAGVARRRASGGRSRRLILHLPLGWPWAAWFELALARLRCIAYVT